MSQNKTIAQMAAKLSGDPSVEDEVQKSINNSRLTTILTRARLQKKVSQKTVAERMGCDPTKISRLESGEDSGWKITDVSDYTNAIGYNFCLSFDDSDLPLSSQIKQRVFQIKAMLDELAVIARKNGDDDKLCDKIYQFFGEVLFNFTVQHEDSQNKLPKTIKYNHSEDIDVDEKEAKALGVVEEV